MTCSSNTTSRTERWLALLLAAVALAGALAAPARAGDAGTGDLILEAKTFLREGDGIAAEAKLKAALDKGAARKAVAAWMGEALLAQGKTDRAARWLRQGDFSPSSAAAGYRALARLERAEGDLRAAGRAYDRAIRLTPDDADMWVEIGRLRYAGGEHLLAIDAADHAVEIAPENPAALLFKAQLLRDSRGLVSARPLLEKAHQLAPADIEIMGELAATHGEAGEARAMLAMTRKMLERDPDNPRAYYLQAVMAARAGNYDLARSVLARTEGRLDELPGKMLLEGVIEIGVGNHALAVEALERLYRKQPGNLRARDLLARALYLAGEHKYLVEQFAGVAAGEGGNAYLRTLVGRAFEQLDQRERAAPFLQLAATGRDAPVQLRDNGSRLGELLAAQRFGEARALAGGWVNENPGYFDNLAAAGDVALANGDGARAADYYARAARIRQTDSLMQRRFQALLMARRMEEAVVLSNSYLANHPTSPAAIRTAGWLAAWSGDWTRAQVLYEALAARGHGRDVQFLSDLSLVQMNVGDAKAAAETARQAYLLQRANPMAAQAWGVSLTAAETSPKLARAMLDKARAIMGDNPLLAQARLKLARIG